MVVRTILGLIPISVVVLLVVAHYVLRWRDGIEARAIAKAQADDDHWYMHCPQCGNFDSVKHHLVVVSAGYTYEVAECTWCKTTW